MREEDGDEPRGAGRGGSAAAGGSPPFARHHCRPQRRHPADRSGRRHRLGQRARARPSRGRRYGRSRRDGGRLSPSLRPEISQPASAHERPISDRPAAGRRQVPRRDGGGDPGGGHGRGRRLAQRPPAPRLHPCRQDGRARIPCSGDRGHDGALHGGRALRADVRSQSGSGDHLPAVRSALRQGQQRLSRYDRLCPRGRDRPFGL